MWSETEAAWFSTFFENPLVRRVHTLGHTIEDDLKVLTRHDHNLARLDRLWGQFDPETLHALESGVSVLNPAGPSLKIELQRLIISGAAGAGVPSTYPFVADIVGNTICADLLDYLQRDHLFAGLPIALGDRFMDDFYVIGSGHKHYAKKMVVRIARSGRPRNDIVTELGKCLRYRYELTERILTHHTKVAADAMVGKLLEMWSDAVWIQEAASKYPDVVAPLGHADIEVLKSAIAAHEPGDVPDGEPDLTSTIDPNLKRSAALKKLDQKVEATLEAEFISRSDDGLLEHLAQVGADGLDPRLRAVRELARAVLDRRLFKLIGHAEGAADTALATEKYLKFGPPTVRREMEKRVADLAEFEHGYDVVVWLPNPDMRLKVAGVLVDDGESVAPLDRVDSAGKEIVEQHRHLWSIGIYAALDISKQEHANRASVLLSQLKDEMDLRVVRWDGESVKSLADLTVEQIAEFLRLSKGQRGSLAELATNAMAGADTFGNKLKDLWLAAQENGIADREFPPDLWP
jgi:hypothetical protein